MKANKEQPKLVIIIDSSSEDDEEEETRRKHIDEGIRSNNFSPNSENFKSKEYTMLADQREADQVAAMYAFDARLKEMKRKRRENTETKKKMKALESDAKILTGPDRTPDHKGSTHVTIVALPDTSEVNPQKNDGTNNITSTQLSEAQNGFCCKIVEEDKNGGNNKGVRSDGGINRDNYVHKTKAEEYKMIAEWGICPQLSAMFASEGRMTKSSKRKEKKRLKKRQQLTNGPTDVTQSSEVQKKNCIEGVVEVINGGRVIPDIGVYKYRTKTEEYRMLADLSNCPRVAPVFASEATMMNNRERSKNKRTEDNHNSAEPDKIPEDKDSTHVDIVASPDTSEVNPQKNDGTDDINSTQLSEAQNGDCSEVVEEDKNGGRNNKGVRSDGGINRDNYVYRTRLEEYKIIAGLGIRPQTSAMIASEARMKKSAKRNEKKRLKQSQQLNNAPADVTKPSEVQKKNCIEGLVEDINCERVIPDIGMYKYRTKAEEYRMLADLSNCPQDAAMFAFDATMMETRKSNKNKQTEENQNSVVACTADEKEGNILKAPETTEEINTDDSLRLVIDPGLSFSEGHEETECLGNVREILEIEQTEALVREEEKVFDRRDGEDIVVEMVKHGDSTKAAEPTPSLKLGSLKREDNIMLRKLLRSPRYFDFPNSGMQMCNICGKDDHKASECTMKRRKKPCYLCGGFRHTAKRCMQGRECFKCRGRGHLARNCPEEPLSNKISVICLRCGDSGHRMFLCQNDYSSEDLKKIQCYVCKEFGHLYCTGFKYGGQTLVSCYKCGKNDHLGSECMEQERYTRYSRAKRFHSHEVKGRSARKNGEYNEAGERTHVPTTVYRSFLEKEIIPNFVYAPLKSGRGLSIHQGERCGGSTV